MVDPAIDALRHRTTHDLGGHFARGLLSEATFEWRVERALGLTSAADARDVLWDLEPVRPQAHVDRLDGGAGLRVATSDLHATWTVGRARGCELAVAAGVVSRRHARIAKRGAIWTVEDLASRNGTFLNGRGVRRAQLFPGDVVDVGGTGDVVLHVVGWQPMWQRLLDRVLGA